MTAFLERRAASFLGGTLSAFRYPNYRLFWGGLAFSVTGQIMEWVCLGWLVLTMTNSPLSVGVTGLLQAAPRLVLSFVGGAIADRVDRRKLLIATQVLSAVLYFVLATLVVSGLAELWLVFTIAFVLGCVRSFDGPARQALLPHVVGSGAEFGSAPIESGEEKAESARDASTRAELANAVAINNVAWEAPKMVAPAIAGILVASIGIGPTLYVTCAGFLLSATLFGLIRVERAVAQGRRRGLAGEVLDGLEVIRRNPIFGSIIGLVFFNSVFGASYTIMLPVYSRDVMHVDSQGFGFLVGAAAVGGVVGSFLAAGLARVGRRGHFMVGGAAIFGVLLVGFALSPWYGLSVALIFSMALASTVCMVTSSAVLQLRVPNEFRARVMGVWALNWSLMPLGGSLAGAIAEFGGVRLAIGLGGVLVAAMALVLALAVPRIRELE